METGEEDSIF